MAVVAASSLATRRGAIIAVAIVAFAAALGVAVFRPGILPNGAQPPANAVSEQVAKGVDNLKALGSTVGTTVADIFGGRSPGERLAGVLANLKQKRHAPLHQRALPKVRRPGSPLAAIVGAPVVPPIASTPPETPLYNVVNGTPAPVTIAQVVPPGTPLVVFPGFTPPPGGGGGIIIPPVVTAPPPVTPPIVPVTPVTPAVPEPATWAMMLLGFAMMGRAVRRVKAAVVPIAAR